jgi:hypothetical protein
VLVVPERGGIARVLVPGAVVVCAPVRGATGAAVAGGGAVAVVVGVTGAGTAAAGAVVTVRVTWVLVGLELPARSTRAAVRTPSESATTATIAAIGARQFGLAASRVRAAAPQRRHHSCSACNGLAQSGQASRPSTPCAAGPAPATGGDWDKAGLGAVATSLTCPARADR